MATIAREVLEDACYQADLEPEALYLDYSGRGMYGEACVGLVHANIGQLLAFAAALARQEDGMADTSWLEDARQDNMGLSIITYWPRLKIKEEAVA